MLQKSKGFERQKAEDVSKVFARSIYFVRKLKKGHVIQRTDSKRIRPGMGLSPNIMMKFLEKGLRKW